MPHNSAEIIADNTDDAVVAADVPAADSDMFAATVPNPTTHDPCNTRKQKFMAFLENNIGKNTISLETMCNETMCNDLTFDKKIDCMKEMQESIAEMITEYEEKLKVIIAEKKTA